MILWENIINPFFNVLDYIKQKELNKKITFFLFLKEAKVKALQLCNELSQRNNTWYFFFWSSSLVGCPRFKSRPLHIICNIPANWVKFMWIKIILEFDKDVYLSWFKSLTKKQLNFVQVETWTKFDNIKKFISNLVNNDWYFFWQKNHSWF